MAGSCLHLFIYSYYFVSYLGFFPCLEGVGGFGWLIFHLLFFFLPSNQMLCMKMEGKVSVYQAVLSGCVTKGPYPGGTVYF